MIRRIHFTNYPEQNDYIAIEMRRCLVSRFKTFRKSCDFQSKLDLTTIIFPRNNQKKVC
jgi:hypothetical protein